MQARARRQEFVEVVDLVEEGASRAAGAGGATLDARTAVSIAQRRMAMTAAQRLERVSGNDSLFGSVRGGAGGSYVLYAEHARIEVVVDGHA